MMLVDIPSKKGSPKTSTLPAHDIPCFSPDWTGEPLAKTPA